MSSSSSTPSASTPLGAPRVRIAPSPTGDPHVGTAYIALFNYVFARRHGGQFVLRIEDTDRERSSASSEQAILSALRWLGLDWDEGPDIGGDRGPYRQSERLAIYREHVDTLLGTGHAYRCFCTRERLDTLREQQRRDKSRQGYDGHCRGLDAGEIGRRVAAGEEHVVRFAMPDDGETVVDDQLRGELRFANVEIDDQVILKSDGYPTYHLANVVDDHLMGITHVIRGEEWITSTPKHLLLYAAFGWEAPRFCHLGLLRNADKSKLSKRKNPVSVFHYRDLGYLPATFLNFLGTLGFSLPNDQERFSLDEMIAGFDWSRVSTGGPIFDQAKLDAFSADDLRALDDASVLALLRDRVLGDERLLPLVAQAKPRISRLDDFLPYVSFFFGGEVDYSQVATEFRLKGKRTRDEVVDILSRYVEELERDPEARGFTAAGLEAFSRAFGERHRWKPRELFSLLRISATGRTAAPSLFDTLQACGKDRVRLRLRSAIEFLRRGDAF